MAYRIANLANKCRKEKIERGIVTVMTSGTENNLVLYTIGSGSIRVDPNGRGISVQGNITFVHEDRYSEYVDGLCYFPEGDVLYFSKNTNDYAKACRAATKRMGEIPERKMRFYENKWISVEPRKKAKKIPV